MEEKEQVLYPSRGVKREQQKIQESQGEAEDYCLQAAKNNKKYFPSLSLLHEQHCLRALLQAKLVERAHQRQLHYALYSEDS